MGLYGTAIFLILQAAQERNAQAALAGHCSKYMHPVFCVSSHLILE